MNLRFIGQRDTFHFTRIVNVVKSKGVNQHRKREGGKLTTEIQADFMHLSLTEELSELEEGQNQNSMKILVLREMSSSSIGAIVFKDNVAKDRNLLLRWLSEFGLESTSVAVTLVTDSEDAVKSFVTNCSDKFVF